MTPEQQAIVDRMYGGQVPQTPVNNLTQSVPGWQRIYGGLDEMGNEIWSNAPTRQGYYTDLGEAGQQWTNTYQPVQATEADYKDIVANMAASARDIDGSKINYYTNEYSKDTYNKLLGLMDQGIPLQDALKKLPEMGITERPNVYTQGPNGEYYGGHDFSGILAKIDDHLNTAGLYGQGTEFAGGQNTYAPSNLYQSAVDDGTGNLNRFNSVTNWQPADQEMGNDWKYHMKDKARGGWGTQTMNILAKKVMPLAMAAFVPVVGGAMAGMAMGAQNGGSLGDVLKGAALGGLTSYAGGALGGTVGSGLSSAEIATGHALPQAVSSGITGGITGAGIGAGTASITGQDIGRGALLGGVSGAASGYGKGLDAVTPPTQNSLLPSTGQMASGAIKGIGNVAMGGSPANALYNFGTSMLDPAVKGVTGGLLSANTLLSPIKSQILGSTGTSPPVQGGMSSAQQNIISKLYGSQPQAGPSSAQMNILKQLGLGG